jgi:predicted O-methyltransferase YrrM
MNNAILIILEEKYSMTKPFIDVTKSEYNLFKEYLRSYYSEDDTVTFTDDIMYNGKIIRYR